MIARLFTWWNGFTLGAWFDIRRRANFVGEDEFGNRYFEDRRASLGTSTFYRRYVVYEGLAEPSKIPPDWHGWLHHALEEPPTESPLPRRNWEKDHKPNLTGTLLASKPKGSLSTPGGKRQETYADYDAWTPDA
ncbi:MAG: NADH:ubiquinone oxidoreductase subunit NDUFA12 [Pseudomonadota bacterium]